MDYRWTVKNIFNVKGLISSNGNPKLKDDIVNKDAALVTRLKNAGAIIIGKTNLAAYTDNYIFASTPYPPFLFTPELPTEGIIIHFHSDFFCIHTYS